MFQQELTFKQVTGEAFFTCTELKHWDMEFKSQRLWQGKHILLRCIMGYVGAGEGIQVHHFCKDSGEDRR